MNDQATLAVIFAALALLYATAGQAGGTAFLAAMALAEFPAEQMRPTALLLNVVAAGYATLWLHRDGRIDWMLLGRFLVPALPAAFAGGLVLLDGGLYLALTGVLESLAGAEPSADRVQQVLDAAYRLGEGEARSGRSMDALAAAYRIGTHRAWDILSEIAVDAGLPAGDVARFA